MIAFYFFSNRVQKCFDKDISLKIMPPSSTHRSITPIESDDVEALKINTWFTAPWKYLNLNTLQTTRNLQNKVSMFIRMHIYASFWIWANCVILTFSTSSMLPFIYLDLLFRSGNLRLRILFLDVHFNITKKNKVCLGFRSNCEQRRGITATRTRLLSSKFLANFFIHY